MSKTKVGTLKLDKEEVAVVVNSPEGPEPTEMTKDDVWGKFVREGTQTRKFKDGTTYQCAAGHWEGGMVVARGNGHDDTPPTKCPIFGDEVPYKSVTVVCPASIEEQVIYWLGYVQGGDCVSKRKVLPDGRVAVRADYMCW